MAEASESRCCCINQNDNFTTEVQDSMEADVDDGIRETGALMQEDSGEVESDTSSTAMTCPLFMQGLPRDFESNPQLAAIASLLEDTVQEETNDDDDGDDVTHIKRPDTKVYQCVWNRNRVLNQRNRPGYGTAKRSFAASSRKHRSRASQHSPYPKCRASGSKTNSPGNDGKKQNVSIGETTLFLNMWKL
jgi:hypothetical protein